MSAIDSDFLCQKTADRIATLRAEANREICIQAAKNSYSRSSNKIELSNWSPRQRLGYLLLRWGYHLVRENQAI